MEKVHSESFRLAASVLPVVHIKSNPGCKPEPSHFRDSLGVGDDLRPPRAVSVKWEIERTPLAKVNTGVIFGVGSEWMLFPLCAGGCGFGADAEIESAGRTPSLYAVRASSYDSAWLMMNCPIRLFLSTELVG